MGETNEDQLPCTHFEQIILNVQECFVYRIPTLRSASGHRAEDWSLASPQFTGALRIYQSDLKLRIALFTYNDPTTLSMAVDNLTLFGGANGAKNCQLFATILIDLTKQNFVLNH